MNPQGITVDEVFYKKNEIKKMNEDEIKTLLLQIQTPEKLLTVAKWHSNNVLNYVKGMLKHN